jgi:hypothetical protein
MTDLTLDSAKVGDTVAQEFQWADEDEAGVSLTNAVLRTTIRRADYSDPPLLVLTSYPDGGLTKAANQVSSPGVFTMRIEAYQSIEWPYTEDLFCDAELTLQVDEITLVDEDATVVAGSPTFTVSAADAALLRRTHIVSVNSILLTITEIDGTSVTTDYVWPASATHSLAAWTSSRQTRTFTLPIEAAATLD